MYADAFNLINICSTHYILQWQGDKLGWHKEDINPHLLKHINTILLSSNAGNAYPIPKHNIFVPLCGKSIDLVYLATHTGISNVVGIDIVRNAAVDFASEHTEFTIQEVDKQQCKEEEDDTNNKIGKDTTTSIQKFKGNKLTILIDDLFKMPTNNRYDIIYDRASIVAIKPSLRQEYVNLMGTLLQPGGSILLVTLDRRTTTSEEAKNDGPPFSLDEKEIRQLYETQNWVESVTLLEEVNDLTTDEDAERWKKKGVLELYELVFLIRKK